MHTNRLGDLLKPDLETEEVLEMFMQAQKFYYRKRFYTVTVAATGGNSRTRPFYNFSRVVNSMTSKNNITPPRGPE